MSESGLQVAIAGASGFVGKALGRALGQRHRVVGLSRTVPSTPGEGFAEWRSADFLSLLDAERALEGAEVAYYLIHSMMPSARLTQGHFSDFDVIAADNFARAAKARGVRHIVYLGGLIPESGRLSAHLSSRMEVEEVLAAYGTPVTTLRAGMIVGPGGSSFVLMERLVDRLPVMVCPSWTRTETQPIALNDIVSLLAYCGDRKSCFGQVYDVGGPEVLTYEEMMTRTARMKGRTLRTVRFPLFTPGLSRLWVSLVTGAPRALVSPLIQSLKHPMVARDRRLQKEAGVEGATFEEMIGPVLERKAPASPRPKAFEGNRSGDRAPKVCSVQRLRGPSWVSATWVAKEYLRWLPRLFVFFIRVKASDGGTCAFHLWPLSRPLLVLEYSKERSTEDRALFYVRGGLLARGEGRGRLEFREVLNRRFFLASVLEFRPRLPWYVYTLTQAQVHRWVMGCFGRHLRRVG